MLPHKTNVAVQNATRFVQTFEQLVCAHISNALRNNQLSLNLEQRASCLTQELASLTPCKPTLALSDVGRNGNSALSQLRSQSKNFPSRKTVSESINLFAELHRALPRK